MARHRSLAQFELFVLLAVTRLGGTAFGADLRREIERRTGRPVALGALYATLKRLEDRGFVEFDVTDPRQVPGGRARKRFALTESGSIELERAVGEIRGMLNDLPSPVAPRKA